MIYSSGVALKNVDFFDLEDLLSDEEKLVRDSVRSFAEDNVIPIIEKHFTRATFPINLVELMGEMGFFGANLQGYGCAGLNNVCYGLMMQELERADSGLRSFASVQTALVMYPIQTFGSQEQREKWLPRLRSGSAIGCFGLTEPDFGSNPAGLRTQARRESGHFVLNGTKAWVTNASIADVALVWARCDDNRLRGFLVEKGTQGFESSEYQNKYSLRASVTGELIFTHYRIDASSQLPKTEGLKHALQCLNEARFGIAWGALGSAIICYDVARHWALERKQFGDKPIASHQLVQAKLVSMLTEITKAHLLAYRLAQLKDRGALRPEQISMAKRNNVDADRTVAQQARDILGAAGILSDYPIFRHLVNLEAVYTYEGTHDIHTLIIGQKITGISAFE